MVHIFTECKNVEILWSWFRKFVLSFLDSKYCKLSNMDIIFMILPKSENLTSIIWLISTYVFNIYTEVFRRRKRLKLEQLIVTMELKYVEHMNSGRVKLAEMDFRNGMEGG